MSIIVLQTFEAAEGKYQELADMLTRMLPDTAAQPGAEIVRAAADPEQGVVKIFEQWDGPENLRAYLSWRMGNTDMAAFMSLMRGPPKIEQLARIY